MSVDLTRALQIPVQSSMFEHDLRRLAELATGCQKIIELGCYHGRSTRALLDSSDAHIWCVDNWNLPPVKPGGREVGDKDVAIFLANITDKRHRVTVLRMLTSDAVGLLPAGCFDLVCIDADHSYEAVKFDILHYAPLLKTGGILCGHDYGKGREGVIRAVDETLADPQVPKGGVVWWARKEADWMLVSSANIRSKKMHFTSVKEGDE